MVLGNLILSKAGIRVFFTSLRNPLVVPRDRKSSALQILMENTGNRTQSTIATVPRSSEDQAASAYTPRLIDAPYTFRKFPP